MTEDPKEQGKAQNRPTSAPKKGPTVVSVREPRCSICNRDHDPEDHEKKV